MSSLRLKGGGTEGARRRGSRIGGPADICLRVSEPHLQPPAPLPSLPGNRQGSSRPPQGDGFSGSAYLGRDGKCD